MEYLIIAYPQSRIVIIDGEEGGITNSVICIEKGTHTFDLGEPLNYHPEKVKKRVRHTTSVKPMEIFFEEI